MPLQPGDKIGPHEILAPIGAGGMGEVYKARDTKLNREVAIKVLPAALAQDPERLARFEREAKVLASLNHPNIATIYGIEESNGVRALVMELVPGAPLQGPLPLETALDYARQIADAVEAAHDQGIIHRDLKPANIMVTPAGMVKVLDFGLAAVAQPSTAGTSSPQNSPTLTMAATQTGMIMGTAAYMSPEQAAGKPVDRRADIWSYGVVLYEMLVGKQLFGGETISHTLADVLRAPIDFDQLSKETPRAVRDLVKRCLDRDVKKRLRDIGEARIVLSGPLEEAAPASSTAPSRARLGRIWPAAAAVLALALGAVSFIHFRETPPPEQTLRYTVTAPESSQVHSFAISPDGRTLVIAASVSGKLQLWLRPMDALHAQPMAFTEDATYPFWSPDSRQIGFFAQGKLKKIAASGGPAQSLCGAPDGRGGSWNRDDVIVFTPASGGTIQRVAAAGGAPVDLKIKDGRHPAFLADGRHFLYTMTSAATVAEQGGIYVGSLDGKENRRLLADRSRAVFAPPAGRDRNGHILFVRENTLMAAPFDATRAQPSGDVFPVAEGVSLTSNTDYVPATVSDNGVRLFQNVAGGAHNQLVWYDRSGKLLGSVGSPGAVWEPAISPDATTVAYARDAVGSNSDIWLHDLIHHVERRFTADASQNNTPVWSPKGDRIVFRSTRSGQQQLYQKAASGTGREELLPTTDNNKFASQWSRDGRFIVITDNSGKDGLDLWFLPVGEGPDRKPVKFLLTPFQEGQGQISPDGHWMAYASDVSGQNEVYVRPFPPAEGEWRVSTTVGGQPRWRGDGKELFFVAADGRMMATPVRAAAGPKPVLDFGAPTPLFDSHITAATGTFAFQYDVTADGKRFLVATNTSTVSSSPPLTVVTNWTAGLKK